MVVEPKHELPKEATSTDSARSKDVSKGEFSPKPRAKYLIYGKLKHPNGDPATNQKVEVYQKNLLTEMLLGTFRTDKEGKFQVEPDKSNFKGAKSQKVTLKVFEEKLPVKDLWFFESNERIVFECDIELSGKKAHENVGDVIITLYEYQPSLPDLKQPENENHRPQQWTVSYKLGLAKAGLPNAIKGLLISGTLPLWKVPHLQKLYGVFDPTLEVSSESTVEMILNGIYPCYFRKGDIPSEIYTIIDWRDYDIDSGSGAKIPTVKLFLNRGIKGLDVTRVDVMFRDEKEFTTYKVGDLGFERALYLFNCMGLVAGEIISHLGIGHLYTGQAAMAVFRTMNANPLKNLLCPHLRGILEIDKLGATAVYGKNGVLNVSGLSPTGIMQTLQTVLGGMCYTTFRPREPLTTNHRFARGEQLFWEVVTKVVDDFFVRSEEGIKAKWYEVFYMSKNIVEHSCPHIPWERESNYSVWLDHNEIDDPNLMGRVEFNGVTRAMRPITLSLDGPQEGDMERLKQFCRVSIFTSTFWHWVIHRSQGKWGTNLKFGSMAPRETGASLEEVPYGGIKIPAASQSFSVVHTFMDFQRGFLLKNPNGDIYNPFIEELKVNRDSFQTLGYNIDELMYGAIM
ncbi:MAG: hypothetical protein ACI9YB_002548 [Halioglobus sp.]|jgi:hypothetical protein